MRTFSYGIVNTDASSINFGIAHSLFSSLSIIQGFIVNKTESSASSSLSVQYNLELFDGAKFGKFLLQLSLSCIQTKSKYTKTVVSLGLITTTNMSPSSRHGRSAMRSSATTSCFTSWRNRPRSGPGVPSGVPR